MEIESESARAKRYKQRKRKIEKSALNELKNVVNHQYNLIKKLQKHIEIKDTILPLYIKELLPLDYHYVDVNAWGQPIKEIEVECEKDHDTFLFNYEELFNFHMFLEYWNESDATKTFPSVLQNIVLEYACLDKPVQFFKTQNYRQLIQYLHDYEILG